MSQSTPTATSHENSVSKIDQYLDEVSRDVHNFSREQVCARMKSTIQEFAHELEISIDDVQMFAETPGNEPAADVTETAAYSKTIAQKCVYSAFASSVAVTMAETHVALSTDRLGIEISRAVHYDDAITIAELRFEMYPKRTPFEVERARMEFLWILDEQYIAEHNLDDQAEKIGENKRILEVMTWLAARMFRLCIIVVRNAIDVDEASMPRAREIDRILSQLVGILEEEVRLYPRYPKDIFVSCPNCRGLHTPGDASSVDSEPESQSDSEPELEPGSELARQSESEPSDV